ncbi:MAG: hypothetical protein ACFE85_20080 [Candidatus Hodarchaeota archaeon]
METNFIKIAKRPVMNDKDYIDDELEEELDKVFKLNEKKPNIFKIIRNEEQALNEKEKRIRVKIKPKKQ